MQKMVAQKLSERATHVASMFSLPDREKNTTGETFEVEKICPLSEYTAYVIYRKNTGKVAVAFFYYLQTGGGRWEYFFPSDSHIIGMGAFGKIKMDIENENWSKNFDN